jgi:hypothetical protein
MARSDVGCARRAGLVAAGAAAGVLAFAALALAVSSFASDCGLPAVLAFLGLGRSGCADDIVRLGFPLLFFEAGGFAAHSGFDAGAFLADALVALGFAAGGAAAGWRRAGRGAVNG